MKNTYFYLFLIGILIASVGIIMDAYNRPGSFAVTVIGSSVIVVCGLVDMVQNYRKIDNEKDTNTDEVGHEENS